jgi:MFS family permease
MTAVERRASIALAGLFALRMLGLFMLLPVFAVAARGLPGGDDPSRVGLALGMYGLTQACMQIPFGIASDRWGRRPVVVAGLMLFVVGSVVCALSTDLFWITVGRAIQGSGAISAAVTAWLADSTRDSVRTRAMAMVGASIGLTFAVSLVIAPLLIGVGGLSGLFWTIGCLGLAAIAVALWVVPTAPAVPKPQVNVPAWRVMTHPDLLRLNLGVFTLHLIQIAMFVVVPAAFARTGGLGAAELWKVYLPIVLVSFVVMVPAIVMAERRGAHRGILRGAVAALVLVCAALTWAQHQFIPLVIAMVAFFSVFNVLEAMQPSLVSRVAPPAYKGLALGFYNTSQAVGLFAGGGLGGWLAARVGPEAVFEVAAVLALLWLVVAWRMTPPPIRDAAAAAPGKPVRSVP